MTGAVYNEIDPFAAEWLEWLAWAGHIADGVVDRRSIVDLWPGDVDGDRQFHTFAGIGVWSYALRLAGWPDDVPVWTGSCPCQPFSAAGRRRGTADERHLWPVWFELIRSCRPAVVLGEQVASPDGLAWLDAVLADLEGAGYTCRAFDLCAAGVGAPHLRQRLYFVAVADGERLERVRLQLRQRRSLAAVLEVAGRGAVRGRWTVAGSASPMGDTGRERGRRHPGTDDRSQGTGAGERAQPRRVGDVAQPAGTTRDLGDTSGVRCERRRASEADEIDGRTEDEPERLGATRGFWGGADWVPCRDGKARPVEPGTFPLAHGAAARVGRLRAYGNAIVAPLAATFIASVIDVLVQP